MAERTNLRRQECLELEQELKNYHEVQLNSIQQGIREIHDLLDRSDGFHADLTSQKMNMLLGWIEHQILPQMIGLFEDSEKETERMLEQIGIADQEKG